MKITIILTATLDNGKETLAPGASLTLEEGEARKLASLGMAKLPENTVPAKSKANGKARGKNSKAEDAAGLCPERTGGTTGGEALRHNSKTPPPPPGDDDEDAADGRNGGDGDDADADPDGNSEG